MLFNVQTEYVINKRASSLFASMDYSSKGRAVKDNKDKDSRDTNKSSRDFK
jgi:hypothetical protein